MTTNTIGPVHERGMFNIEAFDGQRWRGGMNRATREDAISTAKRWAAENDVQHRVFSPDGEVVFDTATAQTVDVLAVLDEAADWLYRSSEGRGDDARAQNVKNVRATVAKLIEAATKLAGNEFIFSTGTAWVDAKNLRAALANIGPQA